MTLADRLLHRVMRSRRLVLGAAVAAGLAAGIAAAPGGGTAESPLIAEAHAQESVRLRVAADAPDRSDATAEPPAEPPASRSRPKVDAEISIGEGGVTIRKRGESTAAEAAFEDMEFDSFEEFVAKAPWLAALVFMVTGLLFLTPVLLIALIVWYKMRSNRLRNETMLKLAERGVVAPADAIAAVGNPGGPPLDALPATAPLYDRAKQVRARAAWSDLRKGIVMLGIGLGLVFWSMLDDGTPNGFGLVLLFVGVGYIVLWYFEERQLTGVRERVDRTPGGG